MLSHPIVSNSSWPPQAAAWQSPLSMGILPGKNTRVGCHALLQGIFLNQGSNPGLPHCKQILYQLSYQRCQISYFLPSFSYNISWKIENFIFNWSRNVEISIFSIWSITSKCIDNWTSIRNNAEGNVYLQQLMHFKQKAKFAKVEVVKKKKCPLLRGATLGLQCCPYGMAWEGRPSGETCKHAMYTGNIYLMNTLGRKTAATNSPIVLQLQ